MCTRFVCRRGSVVTGFNFDIDPAVWDHQVMEERDCFSIGILRPDGLRHSYHGVNRNGNAGTLLYVHGNPEGAFREGGGCVTVASLTEQFIRGELTFDGALRLVREKRIVYAPDATMQAVLSDRDGRTLLVEPGIGYREETGPYSLATNYSLLAPKSTRPFLVPGDDRYERAARLLDGYRGKCTVSEACSVLRAVRQEGLWATRVSFVYAPREQAVFYVENNRFDQVKAYRFPPQ